MNHRRVLVVTGSRAEFGLLSSTLDALHAHSAIECSLVVAGSHLIGTEPTIREVESRYAVDGLVEMQVDSEPRSRGSDGFSLARGVEGFTTLFTRHEPDIVLILGDRIEIFAAASTASLLGIRVAHIHGGDVAVGIADDSMRHATTKLSHLHLAATRLSADRILAMGERPDSVFVVGSPAIDGLDSIPTMDEAAWASLGSPEILVQMHPTGQSDDIEHDQALALFESLSDAGRLVVMAPNIDPGSDGIRRAIIKSGLPLIEHLRRTEFIALLRRLRLFVGNSSAGLLECAALGVPVLDIGDRQAGRERGLNVTHVDVVTGPEFDQALNQAIGGSNALVDRRFGSGDTGCNIANLLAEIAFEQIPVRKRWYP